MSATANRADPRRGLLATVHIAKKDLALPDETYRDILERITGKRSAKGLSLGQLEDVKAEMKGLGWKPKRKPPARTGTRPLVDGKEIRKMRALWLTLWHLGIIDDSSEDALAGFARRVTGGRETGIAALRWIKGQAAFQVIEGLKARAERDGGVDWRPYYFGSQVVHDPRARVIEAQYRRLNDLGILGIGDISALDPRTQRLLGLPHAFAPMSLDAAEADGIIAEMGALIRAALAKRETRS
jgi:hypothetical protein